MLHGFEQINIVVARRAVAEEQIRIEPDLRQHLKPAFLCIAEPLESIAIRSAVGGRILLHQLAIMIAGNLDPGLLHQKSHCLLQPEQSTRGHPG